MPVEIHVACRRDPASIAPLVAACPVAAVEVGRPQTIRAWSPRAHATLLLRARDVAAVVTFRGDRHAAQLTEYAALVARAFEGVIVSDGVVVEADPRPLDRGELAVAWARLDRIGEAQERARARRRATMPHARPEVVQTR